MATVLKIGFEANSKMFVFAKGEKVETFRPDFVSGSGWICRTRPDGSVSCQTSETRNGKYYETHLSINKNGKIVMTRMKDGVRHQVLCKRIGKWPADGAIVLTGGDVEERRGFFISNKTNKKNKEEN